MRKLLYFAVTLCLCLGSVVHAQADTKKKLRGIWPQEEMPSDFRPIGNSGYYLADWGCSFDILAQFNSTIYASSDMGYITYFRVDDNTPLEHCMYSQHEWQQRLQEAQAKGNQEEYEQLLQEYHQWDPNGQDDVHLQVSVEPYGQNLRVVYTVKNESDRSHTINLGTYLDNIFENNQEFVRCQRGADGGVTALEVLSDSAHIPSTVSYVYRIGGRQDGVTPVDDYWFGLYHVNYDRDRVVGQYYDFSDDPEHWARKYEYNEQEKGDYGMCWTWRNRSIAAGETQTYSILMGKGIIPDKEYDPNYGPDLTFTAFDLGMERIEAGGPMAANIEITNRGNVVMPSGIEVKIRTSWGHTLWSTYTDQRIAPYSTLRLTPSFHAPEDIANETLWFTAQVNCPDDPELRFHETRYSNNESEQLPVYIAPRYTSTVAVSKTSYQRSETIRLSGQVQGEEVALRNVQLILTCNGYQVENRTVTSDQDGTWSFPWDNASGMTGHFGAWAIYPGTSVDWDHPQAEFDVVGFQVSDLSHHNGYGNHVELTVEQPDTVTWDISNYGQVALTDLKVTQKTQNPNLDISVSIPPTLEGNQEGSITAILNPKAVTPGDQYEELTFSVTSAEGIDQDITLYYYNRYPSAKLMANIGEINTTMPSGASVDYTFRVKNYGSAATGQMMLSLPQVGWMQAVTQSTMPSLQPGQDCQVTLRFTPSDNEQIHAQQTGCICITTETGVGITIPYTVETVSDAQGKLVVDVCDDYTYYSESQPHVAGATVTVKHPVTQEVLATAQTDQNGLAKFDLPAGWYSLQADAEKHGNAIKTIQIEPERTTYITMNTPIQTITINFEVVETEVTDEYKIVSTMEFETFVPAPVIEMQVEEQPLYSMEPGESIVFNTVLINRGLIRGNNVGMGFPNDEFFQFTPLVTVPSYLDAQCSATIPVRVTRIDGTSQTRRRANTTGRRRAAGSSMGCGYDLQMNYDYVCGADTIKGSYSKSISSQSGCGGGGITPIGSPAGGGDGEAGCPIGNGGGFSSSTTSSGCICISHYSKAFLECVVDFIPYVGQAKAVGDIIGDVIDGNPSGPLLGGAGQLPGKWGKGFTGVGCIKRFMDIECDKPYKWGGSARFLQWAGGKIGGVLFAPQKRTESQSYDLGDTPIVSESNDSIEPPKFVLEFMQKAELVYMYLDMTERMIDSFLGDAAWRELSGEEMLAILQRYVDNPAVAAADMEDIRPQGITPQQMAAFLERLSGKNPNNVMDRALLDDYRSCEAYCMDKAHHYGYKDIEEMWDRELELFDVLAEKASGGVCAHIKIQINQTMTLTRQAFLGTLSVFNGHDSKAMTDVQLDIKVTNEKGEELTSREMEVHGKSLDVFEGTETLGSTWSLGAEQTGVATIEFIPTRYCAPEEETVCYITGTLTYIDPFTGDRMRRQLAPVPIVVKPSPTLDLHYFQQRDVMGDDPFTDEIEPSEDIEFAMLMINKGAGDANNVNMVTEQPKIIENEKGLFITYEMISSQLNGGDRVLALGQNATTEFGNIPAHSTAYAQWWMRSSLIGHFIDYNVEATHVTSYDNKDLSLLDTVSIHELLRTIEIPVSGDINNTTPAWMVNDAPDAFSMPDKLYFSDGTTQPVWQTREPRIELEETTDAGSNYILTVPKGGMYDWQYGELDDPTEGHGRIASITRLSDGMSIPLKNFWTTRYSFYDGIRPVRENKLHFVDCASVEGNRYRIHFEPLPDVFLAIEDIYEVPASDIWITQPLRTLHVRFNKPIDESTFTYEDLRMHREAINLDMSGVCITSVTNAEEQQEYRIDISGLTDENGYYVLYIQTSDITDAEGFKGENGRSVNWMQLINGTAINGTHTNSANNGVIYDLFGRKATRIQKGIYIVDGKRIMLR